MLNFFLTKKVVVKFILFYTFFTNYLSQKEFCTPSGLCCGPAGATAAKPDPMDWGWGATVVVGTSAKASGLRGLWEESVKYSRNTPKELVFVSVCVVFADLAEPSIP